MPFFLCELLGESALDLLSIFDADRVDLQTELRYLIILLQELIVYSLIILFNENEFLFQSLIFLLVGALRGSILLNSPILIRNQSFETIDLLFVSIYLSQISLELSISLL